MAIHTDHVFPFQCTTFPLIVYENVYDHCAGVSRLLTGDIRQISSSPLKSFSPFKSHRFHTIHCKITFRSASIQSKTMDSNKSLSVLFLDNPLVLNVSHTACQYDKRPACTSV